jgi:glutamine---fructose-6-phosphate transaminase (isomerizing)
MCGLIGYISREQAAPIVLGALGRLEYRGYDSAGIATVKDNRLFIRKDKGKLADVIQKCDLFSLPRKEGWNWKC